MAEYNANVTTITDMNNQVQGYTVDTGYVDETGDQDETYWDYPNTPTYLGYYKKIPELKKAIDALAMWVAGKGYSVQEGDSVTSKTLDNISGWGEDSFESIVNNLIIQKKIFGDAFAEIITDEDDGRLLNIKPLYTGNMRVVVDRQGIVKRYEQRSGNNVTRFEPYQILHLCNDRIANEIHGTSVIEACKWVIDARNEALDTQRKLNRRQLALGVLKVDTENTTKINAIKTQYQEAVEKGEVLVIPKDLVEIDSTGLNPQDLISWIKYLENFFYQALGVPKVILGGSEEFTEASSKIGYLTFEQVYSKEQRELEADFWNQLAIKIKFNKPASIKNELLQSEDKNTGQVGFQPKETTAGLTRE